MSETQIGIMEFVSVPDGDPVGCYCEGHVSFDAFRAAALACNYDEFAEYSEAEHYDLVQTYWLVACHDDFLEFKECDAGAPGAFAVTVFRYL